MAFPSKRCTTICQDFARKNALITGIWFHVIFFQYFYNHYSLERVLDFHLILLKHLYFFGGNGSLRLIPDIRGFTVKLERRM